MGKCFGFVFVSSQVTFQSFTQCNYPWFYTTILSSRLHKLNLWTDYGSKLVGIESIYNEIESPSSMVTGQNVIVLLNRVSGWAVTSDPNCFCYRSSLLQTNTATALETRGVQLGVRGSQELQNIRKWGRFSMCRDNSVRTKRR